MPKPGPKKQFKCKVDLRIEEDLLAKLDEWRNTHYLLSRPEILELSRSQAIRLAIKQMVEK